MTMSNVIVEQGSGCTTFSRCTVDMFEPDVLTVTSIDTGYELREFPPGTWRIATAFDERANILFSIESQKVAS